VKSPLWSLSLAAVAIASITWVTSPVAQAQSGCYRAPMVVSTPVYSRPVQVVNRVVTVPAYQVSSYRAPVYHVPAYRAPVYRAPVAVQAYRPAVRTPVPSRGISIGIGIGNPGFGYGPGYGFGPGIGRFPF
jgi:hypothetical protein